MADAFGVQLPNAMSVDDQRFVRLLALASVLLSTLHVVVDAELHVPGLLQRNYSFSRVREADINIGLFISIHRLDANGWCTSLAPSNVLRSWAMEFAIDEVNRRQDLLPNVTVGFVQMDDCYNGLTALDVAIYFVKDDCGTTSNENISTCCSNSCSNENGNGSISFKSYDVVGVLGPTTSGISVLVAPYLGTFHVPVMSLYATANSLSDKTIYPYFLRLVPADEGQELMQLEV